MGTIELLRHQEKACWDTYRLTQKLEDLRVWRHALEQLNDEIQVRVRLLSQGRVQTSARSYGL